MAEKKVSRRKFLTGTATIAGTAALAACAPKKEAPAVVSGEKPKIVIWCGTTYTPDADEIQDNQIKDWGSKNNVEIEINRMSGDERTPKWKAAFETKQFPDLGAMEQSDLPKFIVSDLMVETTDVMKRLNKLEGGLSDGSFMAGRTADGKHWSVPAFSSTEMFYVRTDLLEEHGLDLPDTWEDVMEVAKAVNKPGEVWGWGMQMGTPSWDSEVALTSKLWAYGASTWDKNGKPAIDSKATRTVLDFVNEAWDAGVIPPDGPTWDDAGNNKAYQTGIAAMIFNTGSVLRYLQTEDEELLNKTAVIPIPKGPKGRFCSGYFYQWGAMNTTKYPDVCLELMEWLMSPEQVKPYYVAGGGNMLPTYKNLLNEEMWQDPYRKVLADMVPNTYSQGYPGINTPWLLDAWMDHTMVTMLNRVLVDGWDNDKAIDEADTALQKYYDDWQKLL